MNDTRRRRSPGAAATFCLAAAILLTSAQTHALDLYQDRRGAFSGIGVGGGLVLQDGSAGGGMYGDVQLGGGPTEHLTLNLDVDVWFQWMGDYRQWVINPGPEVSYFFGDSGFYARAGVAVAFIYTLKDLDKDSDLTSGQSPEGTDDNEFDMGGDFTLGFGYEFFVNADVALDFGLEGDYILFQGDDIISAGFNVGIRYY